MSKYTLGVNLVWTIAAAEAARMGQELIEPAHLLIALFKLEDVGSADHLHELRVRESDITPTLEIDLLRVMFGLSGPDCTRLRRAWRSRTAAPKKAGKVQSERTIHQSAHCHEAFKRVEELARATGSAEVSTSSLLAVLRDHLKRPSLFGCEDTVCTPHRYLLAM